MPDWTDGYVSDIGYTFGYYHELNPLRIKLAFLHAGLVFPEVGTACELGFGQGVSTNLHAATSMVEWHGTDFNPSQAANAMDMARASGAPVYLQDQSFAEFCSRGDLPDFDFIGLHGIWSWISAENRSIIVDFIRRKLKVGGVVYLSYNTQAGWSSMMPIRHLMALHSQMMRSDAQGMVSRIDAALAFADKLVQVKPMYMQANAAVVRKLEKLRGQNRNYMAHEYFNRDWEPMPFSDAAQVLESAKLSYACSALYQDHVDAINLTPEQRALLQEIGDPVFRETVRDLIVNQPFRRDYWVKGPRSLNRMEQMELVRSQLVTLGQPRGDIANKVATNMGEASLQNAVYGPILDVLEQQPVMSLGQIEDQVARQGLTFAHVMQAMLVLSGTGAVMAAQSEQMVAAVSARTRKLNHYICNQARSRQDINYVASPVTGGGVALSRFRQMFLLAVEQGMKTPEEWAQYAWAVSAAQGGKLIKGDVTLETEEENLAEMRSRANEFAVQALPLLKRLCITS